MEICDVLDNYCGELLDERLPANCSRIAHADYLGNACQNDVRWLEFGEVRMGACRHLRSARPMYTRPKSSGVAFDVSPEVGDCWHWDLCDDRRKLTKCDDGFDDASTKSFDIETTGAQRAKPPYGTSPPPGTTPPHGQAVISCCHPAHPIAGISTP